MTPEETRKAAELMLEWANNKDTTVEFRKRGHNDEWVTLQNPPKWNWNECAYRIKPKIEYIAIYWINGKLALIGGKESLDDITSAYGAIGYFKITDGTITYHAFPGGD